MDGMDEYFNRLVEIFEDDKSFKFYFTGIQLSGYESNRLPSQIEIAANIEHLKSLFTD
jgi:hypothetical protein